MVQDVMNAHLDESEIAGVETLSMEEKTNDAAAAGTGTVMDNTVDTSPLDDILDAETGADQKQGL